ncbi:MAG: hypothetical protein LBN32_02245 [Helicobacteraceae bacterium]|jgi:ADP-heptose:LPS heptosyltransferase|nr:hypothetical protein [Helicobacteraceae bacterium]
MRQLKHFRALYICLAKTYFSALLRVSRALFGRRLLILRLPETLGDCLVYTFVASEIKARFYPIKIVLATNKPELFCDNPNVDRLLKLNRFTKVFLPYLHYTACFGYKGKQTKVAYMLLDILGAPPPYPAVRCDMRIDDEELAPRRAELPSRFVVVNPNGSPLFKNDWRDWGFERYQAVVDSMSDIQFVQIGSAGDRLLAGVIDMRGKPIRVSASIIKLSQAGLFQDGGLMHLANAVGTPCVIVWQRSPQGYAYDSNINLTRENDSPIEPPCVVVALKTLLQSA